MQLIILNILFSLPLLHGCQKASEPPLPQTAPVMVGNGPPQEVVSAAKAGLGKAPTIESKDVQVAGNKGADSPAASAPAQFQGVPLLGMLTPYSRPIYLDLIKQVWTGFDKVTSLVTDYGGALTNNALTSYVFKMFASPVIPVPLRMTIQQPLPAPWLPSFNKEITVLFSTVGFAAWGGAMTEKGQAILVMAASPFYSAGSEELLKAPSDYVAVYTHLTQLLNDDIMECNKKFNDPDFVDFAEQARCKALFASTELTSYNQTTKIAANNALSDLYQRRSVKVWRPQCPKDYAALGDIATNGRMDKPYSVNDFSQGVYSGGSKLGEQMATYCLPQKFLAAGKLGAVIYEEPAGGDDLKIYSVVAADANGITEATGLFVAAAKTSAAPTSLWVPAKRSMVMVGKE
jgi:hypothetical protein